MTFFSDEHRKKQGIEQLERELEAILLRLRESRSGGVPAQRVASPLTMSIAPPPEPLFIGSNPHHAILLRHYIKARKSRSQALPGKLFADPAWDILLMLYLRAIEGRETIAKHACAAAGVPGTTSLRYLAALEENGLIERTRGRFDQRTSILTLTASARAVMEQWVENTLVAMAKLAPGTGDMHHG